jgi:hypothetical protein
VEYRLLAIGRGCPTHPAAQRHQRVGQADGGDRPVGHPQHDRGNVAGQHQRRRVVARDDDLAA